MTLRAAFRTVVVACLLAGPASAETWRDVTLDPEGLIRAELLSQGMAAYRAHRNDRLLPGVLAIVDFSKPSSERRFYLIDLGSGAVTPFLVAHGRGSDRDHDGRAESFSDAEGSHATSLGAYRAGKAYQGAHGLSLALDGLDPSNASARRRAIVVHSQWYVSDDMIARHGKLGRSWGCFVVEPREIKEVVRRLEGGGFLYAGF